MKLKVFWVALWVITYGFSKAQYPPQDNFRDYFFKPATKQDGSTPYFLLKLEPGEDKIFFKEHPRSLARHIDRQNYIVSLLPEEASNYKNIFPANNFWKLSPELFNLYKTGKLDQYTLTSFTVLVSNTDKFKHELLLKKPSAIISDEYLPANIISIRATIKDVMENILPMKGLLFLRSASRIPKEEQVLNGFDMTLNKVNLVHGKTPLVNGNGLTASIKENSPDTGDIDFKGRFIATPLASKTVANHATIMSTILAGAGNSFYSGKGVAWGASLISSNFASLLPDKDSAYTKYNITVQNHSYGTGIENFYGEDALAFDISSIRNPALVHVFSAGNSGNLSGSSGQYNGVSGYANLTGSFKMSKNTLSVGSVDSFGIVPVLSSKGPAYDGRVKPDLVAFGVDGSSGAAAIVSGIVLVLQQAYKEKHNGELPNSALVRAILLNSADDVSTERIDFTSGYGSANAYRALSTVLESRHFSGIINQGSQMIFNLEIPANAKNLKVTLAWNDPAAKANAFTALVNDLDIELIHPASSQKWKPWVLNSFADPDSLKLLPVRKRDSLNNVEQITLDEPLPGNYQLRINGELAGDSQDFYIAYQYDTASSFLWTFPAKKDNLLPDANALIRWECNFKSTGNIELSLDGGTSWQTIKKDMDLSKNYFNWAVPDTFSNGLLRMNIADTKFLSDSFTISGPLVGGVGFNCPDSVLLYWNKEGNSDYIVYKLGSRYMEPLSTHTDTLTVLRNTGSFSPFIAIAPRLKSGDIGVKSYTFNYATQGIACYFQNFLADLLADGTTQLSIELGTIYEVKKMELQKIIGNEYKTTRVFEPVSSTQLQAVDSVPSKGSNVYRVKISLNDGKVIYSDTAIVYNLSSSEFIVFPNPLKQGQRLNVLSSDPDDVIFSVYSADGRKLIEKKLVNTLEQIPLQHLSKSVYFYVVTKNGSRKTTGKFVVQ